MRNKTEFELLLEALDSLRLFSACHFLTAQYTSECHSFVHVAELLIVVLLFFMATD